jgi:putative acetyltransferase
MNGKWPSGMIIEDESPQDIEGIRQVNRLAFEGEYEVGVVDRLRQNCPTILSLVAKRSEEVLGHILFSPVRIVQAEGWTVAGMGLGPLAVHPDYQGLGIGSALCRAGLSRIAEAGYPFVIVLGHPEYYPRFGFQKASIHGISSSYQGIPDDAFMISIFDTDVMTGVRGVAYYRQEFDEES